MNSPRSFVPFVALIVAATLSLGGCKSNNPPPAQTADNSQPAMQQPAQQPQQPAEQPAPASNQQAAQQAAPSQKAPAAQPQAMQPAAPAAQAAAQAPAPPAPAAPPPQPPPPPPPVEVTLPAGTSISVHLDSDLSSKTSKPNQGFTATIADSVRVKGTTVIARGARAEGVVVDAKNQGKIKGEGVLSVRLTRVRTKWGSYQVSTAALDNEEKGKGKRTAVAAGGGAGLGAIIGGIAGGGKGAAIGALAGGGAGTAGAAFTGNKEIKLPAETLLTFQTTEPVTITMVTHPDEQEPAEPTLQQPPADQAPPQQ